MPSDKEPSSPRRWWERPSLGDWNRLRWSVLIPLSVSFAAVLAVFGVALFYPLAVVVAAIWGLDRSSAVKDQPNGVAFLITLLCLFVAITLLSAAVWRVAVTRWLVKRKGWAPTDAHSAIFLRRFPASWLDQ